MNGPEERDMMRFEFDDPEMREFERALAKAMRRVEVRPETTAKLMALADEAEQKHQHAGGGFQLIKFSKGGKLLAMPQNWMLPRAWMGGAIAAVLAVGCFVGAHIHTEHERRAQAQQQFQAAERITDQTLQRTREQLQAQGIYLDQ